MIFLTFGIEIELKTLDLPTSHKVAGHGACVLYNLDTRVFPFLQTVSLLCVGNIQIPVI